MRILITGGAGFIGSAVCRHLIRNTGDRVLNLDALTYAANPEALTDLDDSPLYEFVQADIRDSGVVDHLFSSFQPDAVMHLAAESHVDRSIEGPGTFIETNIVGTFVMLQAARKYWAGLDAALQERFRFLHISTDEVYGSLGAEGLFTEETPYAPNSPYSASKASSDHLARAWRHTYGLPVLISNCSNNYGPWQFPEKLIPLMILNALEGKPLPVYGDGANVRDWLYVEDHARALELILKQGRPGEKYNIGGRNEIKNIEVVKTICRLLDELSPKKDGGSHEQLITFVADRPGHDRRYAMDASKVERDLGWRPAETFESGLRHTVAWYLRHKDWVEKFQAHRQRLGLLK